jgi:hypothetical protein
MQQSGWATDRSCRALFPTSNHFWRNRCRKPENAAIGGFLPQKRELTGGLSFAAPQRIGAENPAW